MARSPKAKVTEKAGRKKGGKRPIEQYEHADKTRVNNPSLRRERTHPDEPAAPRSVG
jgi:hypothetical protein